MREQFQRRTVGPLQVVEHDDQLRRRGHSVEEIGGLVVELESGGRIGHLPGRRDHVDALCHHPAERAVEETFPIGGIEPGQHRAEDLYPWPHRRRGRVVDAASPQDQQIGGTCGSAAGFVDQRGLSRARLTLDHDDAPVPRHRGEHCAMQGGEFLGPAHDRRRLVGFEGVDTVVGNGVRRGRRAGVGEVRRDGRGVRAGRRRHVEMRSVVEDVALERPEPRSRVDADLVGQDSTGGGDRTEGVGLATETVERRGEQHPQSLVERRTRDLALQFGDEQTVVAVGHPGLEGHLPSGLHHAVEVSGGLVPERQALELRQQGAIVVEHLCQEWCGPRRVAPLHQGACGAEPRGQPTRVDLLGGRGEAVSGSVGEQDRGGSPWLPVWFEGLAQTRDVGLE